MQCHLKIYFSAWLLPALVGSRFSDFTRLFKVMSPQATLLGGRKFSTQIPEDELHVHYLDGDQKGEIQESWHDAFRIQASLQLRGKSVRSWCDGSSDRSFMGWTH